MSLSSTIAVCSPSSAVCCTQRAANRLHTCCSSFRHQHRRALTDSTFRRLQSSKVCQSALRKLPPLRSSSSSESTTEDSDVPEPETARGAIAIGLNLYNAGKHEAALKLFEKALELPGTGLKRYRDKPPAISDGEKMAALYNIACCHSRLEDTRTGLVALAGCLELGYNDGQQLRSDPDLEFLRRDERFEGLLARFAPKSRSGVLGGFFKNLTGA